MQQERHGWILRECRQIIHARRVGDEEWFSDEGFSELDDDESGALDEEEFGA